MMFAAEMVKMYLTPASNLGTLTDVNMALVMGTEIVLLIVEPSANV